MITIICPICSNFHNTLQRYPHAICNKCLTKYKPLDKNGIHIEFFNKNLFGGFTSKKGNIYGEEHECYINGIKCYADEARFGGIVIQKID